MRYAVVQLNLTPPPVEALRQAFAQTKSLRPHDAATAVRDAFGILAERLSAQDALTVSGVLKELGVATEVVAEDELPSLASGSLVSRIDCPDGGLILYDALGRQMIFDWGHVVIISAGRVGMIDIVNKNPAYFQAQGSDSFAKVRANSRYAEKIREHLLLDVILPDSRRYRADATKLNYEFLGHRRKSTAAANFNVLVADLTAHAPTAALNQGAQAVRNGQEFAYPTRKAFEEETIWQMWKAARKV